MIEFDRSEEFQARILRPKFVSVNGIPLPEEKIGVQLPEGPNEVKIRFAFRGGDNQDAKLRFKARANERYFVPYPRPMPGEWKDYGRKWLVPTNGSIANIFLLPVTLPGMFVDKKMDSIESRSIDVEWAYIRVFSSGEAAGVIAEVRVP